MRSLALTALLIGGCATPGPIASATPLLEPPASRLIRGPAFESPRGRRCSTEEVAMGPVTVAGGWGPRRHACRTGPVPRHVFLRRVKSDRLFRACLSRAESSSLEATVRFSREGAVISIAVEEAEDIAAVEPCLALLTRYQLGAIGCELDATFHVTAL